MWYHHHFVLINNAALVRESISLGPPDTSNGSTKIVIGYAIPWQPAFREGITRGCNLFCEYSASYIMDADEMTFQKL